MNNKLKTSSFFLVIFFSLTISIVSVNAIEFTVQNGLSTLNGFYSIGYNLGDFTPFAGIDFINGSFKVSYKDSSSYSETGDKLSASIILFSLGLKYHLKALTKEEIIPYLLLCIKIPFVSFKAELIDNGVTTEYSDDSYYMLIKNYINKMKSYLISGAFGTKYMITDNFSIGAEAGIYISTVFFTDKSDDIEYNIFGDIINVYSGINLNFRL